MMKPTFKRCRLEASTDIGGISPWEAVEIWRPWAAHLDGMEIIAWRWSTARFLEELPSNLPFPITRLHGPMVRGDLSFPGLSKIGIYDWGMVRDGELLTLAQRHELGVLTHQPHAANGFAKAITDIGSPHSIWIENHHYGEAGILELEAIAAKYADNNLPVNLMVDLAHYTAPWINSNFSTMWERMLDHLERLVKLYPVGVHFPIGNLPTDSLPILDKHTLTDDMLLGFKEIQPHLQTMVLECQSPKWEYGMPPVWRRPRMQTWLKQVFERFEKVGIWG